MARFWTSLRVTPRSFSIVIFLMLSAMALAVATVTHLQQRDSILREVDGRLLMAAEMARGMFPSDYHDGLQGPDDVETGRYLEWIDRYNSLCRKLGIQYLWSVIKLGPDDIRFTSSTSSSHDITNRDHALFFDRHSDPRAFDLVFSSERPAFSTFTNQLGSGRMVLLPFRDHHGRPYAFGASIATSEIESRLYAAALANAAVAAMLLVLSGGLAFLTSRLSGRFADSLRRTDRGRLLLEHSFRGLEAVTHAGGWWLSLTDRELYWTDQTYHLHEVPVGTPLTVEGAIAYYLPRDRPRISACVQRCIDDGTPWNELFELATATGRLLTVQATGDMLRDEKGTPTHLYGTFQDVTEFVGIKRREAAYAEIVEKSPTFVVVIDQDFRLTYSNPACVSVLGMAGGQSFLDGLDDGSRALIKSEAHDALLASGVWQGVLGLRTAAGHSIKVNASCFSQAAVGAPYVGFFAHLVDVSELTQILEHKDVLLKAVPTFLFVIDRSGLIIDSMNEPHFPAASGARRVKNCQVTEVFPGSSHDQLNQALKQAWIFGSGSFGCQIEAVTGTRDLRVELTRFGGNRILMTGSDITEAAALLREKVVLLRELNHRVKNNFQTISALISLSDTQARNLGHEGLAGRLAGLQDRIHVMSLIHESLYSVGSLEHIDIQAHFRKITQYCRAQYGAMLGELNVLAGGGKVEVASGEAIYLGLYFVELLSNTARHVRAPCIPTVWYGVSKAENLITFVYRDDGGFFEAEPSGYTAGVGSDLMQLFARALRARIGRCPVGELPEPFRGDAVAYGAKGGFLYLSYQAALNQDTGLAGLRTEGAVSSVVSDGLI